MDRPRRSSLLATVATAVLLAFAIAGCAVALASLVPGSRELTLLTTRDADQHRLAMRILDGQGIAHEDDTRSAGRFRITVDQDDARRATRALERTGVAPRPTPTPRP